MAKPPCYRQNRLWLPPPCHRDGRCDHPDLYLLRDAMLAGVRARSPTTWRRPLRLDEIFWMLPKMDGALCGKRAAYFLA